MRFHCGPTPEDDGFAPEAEGWLSIREPKPLALQLMALPVAFGVLLLCGALLYLVFPRELLTKPAVIPVPFWPLLAILVLFAPVHGCLHAPGPARRQVQDELPLDSTVLKVAHLGAKEGTSLRFLQAVTPQTALIP